MNVIISQSGIITNLRHHEIILKSMGKKLLMADGRTIMPATIKRTSNHYADILLQEVNGRLKKVQEVLSGFKDMQADVRQIKTDQTAMKEWRGITDPVVRGHSRTLNNHESRLITLEAV